jgi:hypothetical protein
MLNSTLGYWDFSKDFMNRVYHTVLTFVTPYLGVILMHLNRSVVKRRPPV